MGGMSASDPAPLPRLGEVFFDVRGNSRSMRISWYADTGVAVLSIWQGGMCTGTFRLAIADLPRMVETLQRGPAGQRRDWDAQVPGEVFAQVPRMAAGPGPAMEPSPGQHWPDRGAEQAEYRAGPAQYQTAQPQMAQPQMAQPQMAQPQMAQPQTARPQMAEDQAGRHLAEPADPLTGTAAYADGAPARAAPSGPPAPPDYLADLPDGPRTGMTTPPDYLADLPDTPRTGMTTPPDYLADLPDTPRTWMTAPADLPGGPRTGMTEPPPEYLPAPPDQPTVPPGHMAPAPGHMAATPGHRAAPPDRPATPPGHAARPADPLTGPAPDPLTAHVPDSLTAQTLDPFAGSASDAPTGPGGYRAQSPEQRAEYLADLLPAGTAGPVGYDNALSAGAPSRASFPPDGAHGPYLRGTGRKVPAGDPYLSSTGPMDYPGSPYPPGTSGPGPDDVPGQETAGYLVPYGGAVTDDILPDPALDSVPYDRAQGRRRAASRHAAPDVPFD
jgi:hypothetical protein